MREKPLSKEQKATGIKIRDPEGDKNFMITFEGRTKKECTAFNWAIEGVLRDANLSPFHQIGTSPTGHDEPGFHSWEVWRKVTKEQLEQLLPAIEEKAKKYLEDLTEG